VAEAGLGQWLRLAPAVAVALGGQRIRQGLPGVLGAGLGALVAIHRVALRAARLVQGLRQLLHLAVAEALDLVPVIPLDPPAGLPGLAVRPACGLLLVGGTPVGRLRGAHLGMLERVCGDAGEPLAAAMKFPLPQPGSSTRPPPKPSRPSPDQIERTRPRSV
jgi:hypothetical protein